MVYLILPILASVALAAPPEAKTYNKKKIAIARFGDADRQALIEKSYGIRAKIDEAIVGQEHVGQAMQDRVAYWLENFGSRKAEPVALHNIGLPGVGKSATLKVLEGLGIPVVYIDAQKYAGGERNEGATYRLYSVLRNTDWEPSPISCLLTSWIRRPRSCATARTRPSP